MRLAAEIAKHIAKTAPASISRRLLGAPAFTNVADVPILSVGRLGSFSFEKVTQALEVAARTSGEVELRTRNGKLVRLRRLDLGQATELTDEVGAQIKVPDFAFLDPEDSVRLTALDRVAQSAWPELPSRELWLRRLAFGPLGEGEFAALARDIRAIPSQFLASLQTKWNENAEIGYEDVFPDSPFYFQALTAPIPTVLEAGVDQWFRETLEPRLIASVGASLEGGIRQLIALNWDDRVNARNVLGGVKSAELLAQLRPMLGSSSIVTLMGTLRLALQCLDDDSESRELISRALVQLVSVAVLDPLSDARWQLLAALCHAGMRKISVREQLCAAPVFYRRLVASAHAALIVQSIEIDTASGETFIAWLDGVEDPVEAEVAFLDCAKEPLWRGWNAFPGHLRAWSFRRFEPYLETFRALESQEELAPIVVAMVKEMEPAGLLIHGPIQTGQTRIADLAVSIAVPDSIHTMLAESVAQLTSNPIAREWGGIAAVGQMLKIDQGTVDLLIDAVGRLKFLDDDSNEETLTALHLAGDIAARQPSESLGDAVASSIIGQASKLHGEAEIHAALRILLVASASRLGEQASSWSTNRIADFAFSVKTGLACNAVVSFVDRASRLTSLDHRVFGRAKEIARAGLS